MKIRVILSSGESLVTRLEGFGHLAKIADLVDSGEFDGWEYL